MFVLFPWTVDRGQDGKEVAVRFEIRDMTAGGEGMQLSVLECKKASVYDAHGRFRALSVT